MPRNMSFMLTKDQVKAGTKRETRRAGWLNLKVGTILNAVEQAQGLKKGEHVKVIRQILVTKVKREPLCRITRAQVAAEGFPGMQKHKFVAMFCASHKNVWPSTVITRICFDYI